MKFCVIGLGTFGYHIAETLALHGMEVLGIDSNEAIIASIKDKVTQAICMAVTNEESLRAVGIEEMDTVIVSMGENFAQSILITALLKKHLNIPFVIARSISDIHEDILRLVGADKVISPEREVAIRLANTLSFPFIDVISVNEDFSISQIRAPHAFIGKTLEELDLRRTHGITCIGVKKGDEVVLVGRNYIILDHDQLIIAGNNENLEAVVRT